MLYCAIIDLLQVQFRSDHTAATKAPHRQLATLKPTPQSDLESDDASRHTQPETEDKPLNIGTFRHEVRERNSRGVYIARYTARRVTEPATLTSSVISRDRRGHGGILLAPPGSPSRVWQYHRVLHNAARAATTTVELDYVAHEMEVRHAFKFDHVSGGVMRVEASASGRVTPRATTGTATANSAALSVRRRASDSKGSSAWGAFHAKGSDGRLDNGVFMEGEGPGYEQLAPKKVNFRVTAFSTEYSARHGGQVHNRGALLGLLFVLSTLFMLHVSRCSEPRVPRGKATTDCSSTTSDVQVDRCTSKSPLTSVAGALPSRRCPKIRSRRTALCFRFLLCVAIGAARRSGLVLADNPYRCPAGQYSCIVILSNGVPSSCCSCHPGTYSPGYRDSLHPGR